MNPEHLRREVIFKAVRSRGPGGQNVNRTASAAHITWYFEFSELLNEDQKRRLREKAAHLINSEGAMHFRSDEFRDLERNKSRSLEKLAEAIKQALHVPKKRKATKPTKASKERRHEHKSRRGDIKKLRRKVY